MDNPWSDELLKNTRQILEDNLDGAEAALFLGYLNMKNTNGSFGKISLENLMARKLCLEDKTSEKKTVIYTTVDELIAAGWAID